MKPGLRVLLTSLAGMERLREVAGAVREGALVGLGARDELPRARRLCAEFDHVMFVEGSREDIPWADAWFDLVLDDEPDIPTAGILRVLRPGGSILSPASALAQSDDTSPHLD